MGIYYSSIDVNRPEWLGGAQWMLRGLRDITVVFGRNGAGKSKMLRAIHGQASTKGTFPIAAERGGDWAYDQGISQSELSSTTRGSTRAQQNAAPNYRRESVSRIGSLMTKIGFVAGTAENSLKNDHILSEMSEHLSALLPEFKIIATQENPHYKLSRLNASNGEFANVGNPVNDLSSGETETLTLGLDLLTACYLWELENQNERVLLIDEPDPHMHPELQNHFAKFLFTLVDRFQAQIILATHSTTLLSALGRIGFNRVGVLYLSNSIDVQQVHQFDNYLKTLSGVLGGHALVGPLFGAPLLLVEGDDDNRIWSQVSRHPANRNIFAVLPCDGDDILNYQPVLEQLFASLREDTSKPAGYALLDNDKSIPTHGKYVHIPFIKLSCHESENLYLTDEVLASMKLSWEDAKGRLKSRATEFPDIEPRLLDCENWDRKSDDIKDLIGPIATILDDVGLHWTHQVGRAIGQRRPRNELEDFIGETVMNALW